MVVYTTEPPSSTLNDLMARVMGIHQLRCSYSNSCRTTLHHAPHQSRRVDVVEDFSIKCLKYHWGDDKVTFSGRDLGLQSSPSTHLVKETDHDSPSADVCSFVVLIVEEYIYKYVCNHFDDDGLHLLRNWNLSELPLRYQYIL